MLVQIRALEIILTLRVPQASAFDADQEFRVEAYRYIA